MTLCGLDRPLRALAPFAHPSVAVAAAVVHEREIRNGDVGVAAIRPGRFPVSRRSVSGRRRGGGGDTLFFGRRNKNAVFEQGGKVAEEGIDEEEEDSDKEVDKVRNASVLGTFVAKVQPHFLKKKFFNKVVFFLQIE